MLASTKVAARQRKPKGNGRWFYFWYRAAPDLIIKDLLEYSGQTREFIQGIENADETALHNYAERIGLIRNESDFDRSPLGDDVCLSAVHAIEYVKKQQEVLKFYNNDIIYEYIHGVSVK